MNYFVYRIFKIVGLPFLLIFLAVFIWDPFRVFFTYDDYYSKNVIPLNRENVCFSQFEKRDTKPSNYIIGSSRSQAYKTNYWAQKISQNPEACFHYDGSGMGIYRAAKAIQFFGENVKKVDNILLIVDTDFFKEISNPEGHLSIQHPDVSGESKFLYFWTFIKAPFIDPRFIFFNIIYRVTGQYFEFMGQHILKGKNYHIGDNLTGDIWYSFDADIKTDSIEYYNNRLKRGVFYKRPSKKAFSKKHIDSIQYNLLSGIRDITHKHHIDIKIVISPLYNQRYFNKNDLQVLIDLFGENSVYDFSGQNNITSDFRNYYESSHYKPYIANRIMDSVYSIASQSNNTNQGSE